MPKMKLKIKFKPAMMKNNKKKRKKAGGTKKGQASKINFDDIGDIDRSKYRPSVIAKSNFKGCEDAPPRPPLTPEEPFVYRVYNHTVQMIKPDVKKLNSNAAFVLVCDQDRRTIVWIGSACDENDTTEARELALLVQTREYGMIGMVDEDLETLVERDESDLDLLRYFLEKLPGADEFMYRSKKMSFQRTLKTENSSVTLSILQKSRTLFTYEMVESGKYAPDADGVIKRMEFPAVDLSTMVVVNVDDQYYLWISRGVSADDEQGAKTFMSSKVQSYLSQAGMLVAAVEDTVESALNAAVDVTESFLGFDIDGVAKREDPDNVAEMMKVFGKTLRIVRQGSERVFFRRMFKIFTVFEPKDKTVPYVPPEPTQEEIKLTLDKSVTQAGEQTPPPAMGSLYGLLGLAFGLSKPKSSMQASGAGDATAKSQAKDAPVVISNAAMLKYGGGGDNFSSIDFSAGTATSTGVATSAVERRGSVASVASGAMLGSAPAPPITRQGSVAGSSIYAGSQMGGGSVYSGLGGAGSLSGSTIAGSTASALLAAGAAGQKSANERSTMVRGLFGYRLMNEGRDLIERRDLELRETENASAQERHEFIARAELYADTVVGWQIEIDEGYYAGIFVVTGTKKGPFNERLYRITSYTHNDAWVQLKRGSKKGIKFRPLRHLGWL